LDRIVLDSSAVLAMILGERGGERVRSVIQEGKTPVAISSVNWCEALTRLQRDSPLMDGERMDAMLPGVEVVPFAKDVAELAAGFARTDRSLSLGDRACLALAKSFGATAWTADRVWQRLQIDVAVELVRS
jgi:PIN domain nuclease of toxin-antitoxin system